MKKFKFIVLIITVITIQSCSPEDGALRPTSGENSFTAKVNGEQFTAADIHKFKRTDYGIKAYQTDKTWLLSFRNSSNITIYLYLRDIEGVGYYNIGIAEDNLPFLDNRDTETSVLIGDTYKVLFNTNSPDLNEKIKITEIQGDSVIIGEFEYITLSNPENRDDKTIITDGKFNINRTTLDE